jgi:hypothetical protein
MNSQRVFFAGPVVLALALAGCSPSAKERMAADYCPTPFTVQDTQTLTHFKEGATVDPRNIAYEAVLRSASSSCKLGKNQMQLDLVVQVAASPGPAVGSGTTSVPYFVRVIDASGAIVQGREFTADFPLSASSPRRVSKEELTLQLPFNTPADVVAYRIAVGLKPTPEELTYNRSARAR